MIFNFSTSQIISSFQKISFCKMTFDEFFFDCISEFDYKHHEKKMIKIKSILREIIILCSLAGELQVTRGDIEFSGSNPDENLHLLY